MTGIINDKNITRPEHSILTIYIGLEQFSFSIYDPDEAGSYFYGELTDENQTGSFSAFKEAFFEQTFFSLPFRKVWIMNRTPSFAFIPNSIYKDDCRDDFMNFLLSDRQGTLMSNIVPSGELTVLYQLPEAVHRFMIRSFAQPEFIHYSVPLITYFLEDSKKSDVRMMVVNLQKGGLDIFCFSNGVLLLGNYFPCKGLSDALYYILFTWKQLQLNQMDDFLYVAGNNAFKEELIEKLEQYIQQIYFPEALPEIYFEGVDTDCIPFELVALSSCEL